MGRRRQRVSRLPRQLHLADPRPCAPGRRRGRRGPGPARIGLRGADGGRDRARGGDPRPPAIARADPLHEFRDGGDDVRHPRGASVHRPAAAGQVRKGVPRDPRHGPRRDSRGSGRDLRPRRRAAVGRRRRGRARPCRPRARGRGDHHRAGPGRRRRPRGGPGVPAVPPRLRRPDRGTPHLRRDHRVPDRAERGAGRRRRPTGSDDARQDRRRRLPAGGVRWPGRDHGSLRRAAARRDEPRRDVQRQSRRGGRRALRRSAT